MQSADWQQKKVSKDNSTWITLLHVGTRRAAAEGTAAVQHWQIDSGSPQGRRQAVQSERIDVRSMVQPGAAYSQDLQSKT